MKQKKYSQKKEKRKKPRGKKREKGGGGGGGGKTPSVISGTFVELLSPMLIRSSCVLTLRSVRVHVCHVLVHGVTYLRSCRCSSRVLCENTTNTRRALSWTHGNDFDFGSVGIAPYLLVSLAVKKPFLSKT